MSNNWIQAVKEASTKMNVVWLYAGRLEYASIEIGVCNSRESQMKYVKTPRGATDWCSISFCGDNNLIHLQ